MKIKITISREYNTTSYEHADLFEGVGDPVALALAYFADDIDSLVCDNAVKDSAIVQVFDNATI